MSSFGRNVTSHLSMSLHMELNRTYGTSSGSGTFR